MGPVRSRSTHHIAFDAEGATFASHTFHDVRAVGFYIYKDTLIPSYVGFKWYALEADARVHRRERPSESIDMVEIAGGRDVPPFYMSTCEVQRRARLCDRRCKGHARLGSRNGRQGHRIGGRG